MQSAVRADWFAYPGDFLVNCQNPGPLERRLREVNRWRMRSRYVREI